MKKKFSTEDLIFEIVLVLFMIIFLLVTVYPIWNTLVVSFNDGFDALAHKIHFWPHKFTLDNYKNVFSDDDLATAFKNTFLRTVLGTALALVLNALLAFVVSRKRFLFKKSVSIFWLITMYVGGGFIPTFILYKWLHLTNTFWVYVIPGAVSAFNMLVMRNFMNDIPDSLEESAEIDGAGYFTVFTKIISPLCKPVYATIALFVAVWQWNDWFVTKFYIIDVKKRDSLTVLQYKLMQLLDTSQNKGGSSVSSMKEAAIQVTPQSLRCAATIFTMLPIVCVYPFLQRYFVTGLTIGGVKE